MTNDTTTTTTDAFAVVLENLDEMETSLVKIFSGDYAEQSAQEILGQIVEELYEDDEDLPAAEWDSHRCHVTCGHFVASIQTTKLEVTTTK